MKEKIINIILAAVMKAWRSQHLRKLDPLESFKRAVSPALPWPFVASATELPLITAKIMSPFCLLAKLVSIHFTLQLSQTHKLYFYEGLWKDSCSREGVCFSHLRWKMAS